jgi:pSer/pThr/pTyr-binding forkhead associated (FHA) protein
MLKLHIRDQEGHETIVPLVAKVITLGRGEGNTVRLTEPEVSPRHARMVVSDNSVTLEDLDSQEGIRVNDEPITGSANLRVGDVAKIGKYQLYLEDTEDDVPFDPEQLRKFRPGTPTEVMAPEKLRKAAAEASARDLDHGDGRAHPATIHLTEDQIAKLQKKAEEQGVSMEELIGVVLETYLKKKDKEP